MKRLRLELQTETADCGLACISMIANFHGFGVELRDLKEWFSSSSRGHHLLTLKKTLQQLNFDCQTVRFDIQRPEALKAPCILHWKGGHFVVLAKATQKKVTILDPASGKRSVPRQVFVEHATGFALEARPNNQFVDRRKDRRPVLRPFLERLGIGGFILRLLFVSGLVQATALALPFFAQTIFDEAIPTRDTSMVTLLAVSFCAISIFSAALGALHTWGNEFLKSRVALVQHQRLFEKLLNVPLYFFAKRPTSDLLAAFLSLDRIKDVFIQGLQRVLTSGLLLVALFFVLLAYSPTLLWIAVLIGVSRAVIKYGFFYILNRKREETFHLQTQLHSRLFELVAVIQAIKIFSRQGLARELHRETLTKKLDSDFQVRRLDAIEGMTEKSIAALDHILFVAIAAGYLMSGQLTLGEFYALSLYKTEFLRAFGDLLNLGFELRGLEIFRSRLGDVVLHEREHSQRSFETNVEFALRLEDIYFRYSKYEPYIFQRLNLSLRPGESVAIVAPSGYGKTTLCKLMLGLLEPESGSIQIGSLPSHQTIVAAVMQEDHLITASIQGNITFLDSSPDEDRVRWAAHQANILKEIESLPLGFETVIGDTASHISGGQRQRILLARALYQNPSILLLDESTSNLDLDNERIISRNISDLEITRVIFSHRPETIRTCDRVIALQDLQTWEARDIS